MIPHKRQLAILATIEEKDIVSVADLAEQFNVSHMTIRRDIAKLESVGKVVTVTGGVKRVQPLYFELTHEQKSEVMKSEKEAIGVYAAGIIPKNSVVYLDAGTTCLAIAHCLNDRDDLLVITNDFCIVNHLIRYFPGRLYHTGGKINHENSSSVGNSAATLIKTMNIDLAFISSSSWHKQGISTPSEDKVIVKQSVVDVSMRNILVSDHSKYGKVAAFNVLPLHVFDLIITDTGFSSENESELKEMGISLVKV
ncbi:DeoR family transcriptional regulator [Vibrio parahaemolyticus]|nr:DeoR family transcriptional regulator [Vibrio parahaemolyticus]